MLTKVIGFLGIQHYEILVYLAELLHALGNKVLMVDISSTKELMLTLPIPETRELIQFHGIHYLEDCEFNQARGLIESQVYEVVLIHGGFQKNKDLEAVCDEMVLVTDLQKSNIEFSVSASPESDIRYCYLVKDVFAHKALKHYLPYRLQEDESREVFYVEFDDNDKINQLNCQYNYKISYRHMSIGLKEVLTVLLMQWVKSERKDINLAFKKLERRIS